MPTQYRLKCRVCKKVTKQGDLDAANEMMLGNGVALVQCLECGVIGIERMGEISNGKENSLDN